MNYHNVSCVMKENVLNDSVVLGLTPKGSVCLWLTLHHL